MTAETRQAEVRRKTAETEIELRLDLDRRGLGSGAGSDGGERRIDVPNGFFAHMLDALCRHAALGIELRAHGDVHVDLHHTVEDTGIVLGQALDQALGERRGVVRFAHAYAPLDEALARAVIDLSGRGFCVFQMPAELRDSWVTREFPLVLVGDFFQALAERGRLTLHLEVISGRNPHHVAEACFKAVALALRDAVTVRPGESDVPSTKGSLDR